MAKNRLSKEKWQKWEERKRLILSYDFHLTDTSKEREERVDHARRDYAYFVETYFPHLCTDPETKQITKCGKFQLSAAGWLKTHPHTRAVFEWARGHAKSTHISLMIPIWLMIQERRTIHVMVLVSKSEACDTRAWLRTISSSSISSITI